MKTKNKSQKPTKSKFSVLRQICNLIPNHLVPKLARETKVEADARTFKPWSHLVSLLYAQLAHCLGLNDVCDALGLRSGPLSAIRGATAPKRNTLSHANRKRPIVMAKHPGRSSSARKAHLAAAGHIHRCFRGGGWRPFMNRICGHSVPSKPYAQTVPFRRDSLLLPDARPMHATKPWLLSSFAFAHLAPLGVCGLRDVQQRRLGRSHGRKSGGPIRRAGPRGGAGRG
jgi:hypothetical protein